MKKVCLFLVMILVIFTTLTSCSHKKAANETTTHETASQEEATLKEASYGEAPVQEGFEPFIRIDGDSPDVWKTDLYKFRIITKGMYEFEEPDSKYGITGMDPDTTGMDTLNISGSAEFSEQQFMKLAETLRKVSDGKEIYIIDLRRESHALLNGISFSWCGPYNWSNIGLSAEEIENDQDQRFGSLVGKTMTAYPREDLMPFGEGVEYQVETYQTEKDLVEKQGFHYLRIPVLDITWPAPEEVDQFIEFVKGIDMDQVWLHFHCAAGKGRTGSFMFMYDMMKNPEVDRMDIMVRQAKLGGNYMLYKGDDDDAFKQKIYAERSEMAQLFCDYVDENRASGYTVKWSDWLEKKTK